MGKTILTSKQLEFLELIQNYRGITKNFYLTGGTVLSEFYLRHRYSEDIDLFSEKKEVDHLLIDSFLKKVSAGLKVKKINRMQFLGLVSYRLIYHDGQALKVDFNYYPFPRIEKGKNFGNLEVDSLIDIAANKIHTLFMKPRTRDYIDLYFIFKKENLDLKKLILLAKAKFDWDIDRINLANQFIKVKDIKKEDYPKVIVPFKIPKMEEFFLELAKSLSGEIFK